MATVDLSGYSYGTNTYGADGFGVDVLPAVISASATVSVAPVRVLVGSASIGASASVAVLGGLTANSSAQISPQSAATSDVIRVRQTDSQVDGVSAASATGSGVFTSGAVSSATTVTSSVGQKFVLEESGAFAYGTSVYGAGVYDYANFQTIVAATSVGSTASGFVIRGASAEISATSSFVPQTNITRVREGYANPSATVTTSAIGVFSVVGRAEINAQSTVSPQIIRVRLSNGATSLTSSVSAYGREKWEPILIVSETWTPISSATDTWTRIAA